MKVLIKKQLLIYTLLAALLLQGCAKAPEADDTVVILTAPTVAPVVTPVPTPVATPTPEPTPKPRKTPKPKDKDKEEDKQKDQDKDTEKATPKPTEKPKGNSKTPNRDNYTPVELKKYNTKVEPFTAKTSDGGSITEGYFAEGKLTIVNMWSTT